MQKKLAAYDEHIMECLGKFTTDIETSNKYLVADLVVIKSNKTFGLWGRDLITSAEEVHGIGQVECDTKLPSTYLPAIKGVVAKMDLINKGSNVFCRARPVPLALEDEVATELDRLEEAGIITKCIDGGVENASPVVWVRKPNGKLRMCVDF